MRKWIENQRGGERPFLALPLAVVLGVAIMFAAWAQTYRLVPTGLKVGGGYGDTGVTVEETGDILVDGDLTVDGTITGSVAGSFTSATITGKTQVTPASGDFIIGTDATDSDNLKKFDIADILGAGGGIVDGDTLSTGLTYPNTGLHILDTNASHDLIIAPGSNITADRTLTVTTGDASRTLDLSAGNATVSGTNTGDVSLSGTPDYITISGQTITRGAVDLAADVTGTLPVANGGTGLTSLGTANQVLAVNAGATALEFQTVAGGGDVTTVGTPVDGQVAVWTGDGTIEGDAALTFDTTDDTLVVAASGRYAFGAVDILTDAAGTTTLDNIDALGATTESTVEAAIDTLANLTSIQGQTVTVSGTTTVSGTNSGDVALAGTPDYITISGQTITRGSIDLTTDVTGGLPLANIANITEARMLGRAVGAGAGVTTELTVDQVVQFLFKKTTLTSGTTPTWTCTNGLKYKLDLNHNATIQESTGTPFDGQPAEFLILQDSASAYTCAFETGVSKGFAAGSDFSSTIPAISTTLSSKNYYKFEYDSDADRWVLLATNVY